MKITVDQKKHGPTPTKFSGYKPLHAFGEARRITETEAGWGGLYFIVNVSPLP
jgi:hypothetical protein